MIIEIDEIEVRASQSNGSEWTKIEVRDELLVKEK
ncbi:MAG: hypothetical protein Ct9H300mP13_3800 [Gammaproteobacteria bacterium]|nr:MAG: hypothetical protein Ct9H300mP13_3800 [Gammaproteobacteria bacterium]